jgi:hypothetical protein
MLTGTLHCGSFDEIGPADQSSTNCDRKAARERVRAGTDYRFCLVVRVLNLAHVAIGSSVRQLHKLFEAQSETAFCEFESSQPSHVGRSVGVRYGRVHAAMDRCKLVAISRSAAFYRRVLDRDRATLGVARLAGQYIANTDAASAADLSTSKRWVFMTLVLSRATHNITLLLR